MIIQKLFFLFFIFLFGCQTNGLNPDSLGLRQNILVANEKEELIVVDFSNFFSLKPIQKGWYHKTFNFTSPMIIDFQTYKNKPAARFRTQSGGSMLIRHTDIALDSYPFLKWKWLIKKTITTKYNEVSSQGDDSPARLYIQFSTQDGNTRAMEIIWAHQLDKGQIKTTHGFNHFVQRGKLDSLDKWYDEKVNLKEIYNRFWSDNKAVNIKLIAIFCDSDNTKSTTESYFSNVSLVKK